MMVGVALRGHPCVNEIPVSHPSRKKHSQKMSAKGGPHRAAFNKCLLVENQGRILRTSRAFIVPADGQNFSVA